MQMHLDIGDFKLETSSPKGAWPFLGQRSEKPQVQRVCGHSLARGVKALPGEAVRGDGVLASRAPWHLRLSCTGPAAVPQETDRKLCLTEHSKYMQDQMLRHSMT